MSMVKFATTVGGFTMISRVLGFVRDVLIAALLGTGPVAEAFVIAFRIPNLFRRLFGEGAFNAAFVPLFAKRLEADGENAARSFANEALAGLLFALLVFSAIAEVFMPALAYIQAPGFADDQAKFDLTVLMSRIAFPYLTFMSVTAMLGGVLNSMHRFSAAAGAPIVLNIIMIAVMAFLTLAGWGATPATGRAMVWAVSFAGLAQLTMLWIATRRAGMKLKLQRPRYTPGVRRLVQLGIPGVIAGGIAQINLVISTAFASMQDGAAPWLYYADRVYQLPLGIVGVAIGIVLLPELSRHLRANDGQAVHDSQNRALEFSLFLTVPAAIALLAIPRPIIQVLFERGAFSASDSTASAYALAAFAIGLPAFVLIKIFSPGFFAREDTKTPMYFAGVGVAVNVVLALVLYPFWQFVGVALAVSVSAWTNAALLGITLGRRGFFKIDDKLRRALPRMFFNSLLMGFALLAANWFFADIFTRQTPLLLRGLMLAAMVTGGAGIYFVASHLTNVFRWREFTQAFRRNR
jgi:putative peptidoglycan lipid II flippase